MIAQEQVWRFRIRGTDVTSITVSFPLHSSPWSRSFRSMIRLVGVTALNVVSSRNNSVYTALCGLRTKTKAVFLVLLQYYKYEGTREGLHAPIMNATFLL